MASNQKSHIYKNVLAWRGFEKLYLDSRTCDVYFLFKSKDSDESPTKIPAHKNILASVSPVFDAMFYGPAKEKGDIKMTYSTPEAFKEFLQFFYHSSVTVSEENVVEVMNLGKQYMLNDCLDACTDFCEKTLTIDNMCSGYELAILFEQDKLKEFCEQKICDNPKKFFKSNSFLSCKQNLLRHILQLESLSHGNLVVFDGCISWAKAACAQKHLDAKKMSNLRVVLGSILENYRFDEMTIEGFFSCYRSYDGFFTLEEFRDICMKISSNALTKDVREDFRYLMNKSILVCNRINVNAPNRVNYNTGTMTVPNTTFTSNSPLLLKKFYCRKVCSGWNDQPTVPAGIRINENRTSNYDGNLLAFVEILLSTTDETIVELPDAVPIKPRIKYQIEFIWQNIYPQSTQENISNSENIGQGIAIQFIPNEGDNLSLLNAHEIVTRLDFIRQKKRR